MTGHGQTIFLSDPVWKIFFSIHITLTVKSPYTVSLAPNHETWSKKELIARLTELELPVKAGPHYHKRPKRGVSPDTVRKIAVKCK